jgi:hypothetical protein
MTDRFGDPGVSIRCGNDNGLACIRLCFGFESVQSTDNRHVGSNCLTQKL